MDSSNNDQELYGQHDARRRRVSADSQQRSQQPQRRQQASTGDQPQRRAQASASGQQRRQQSAGERQPQARRAQQPAARQSVRADAERQQQARRQSAQRQAVREQQQAEHRQQMREQTMREHQERMRSQRQQQGAAAYSTSNYVARNSTRRSRRNAEGDIRAAAQGGYAPQNNYTPQGNRIGGGGGRSKGGARKPGSHRKRNIILAVVAVLLVLFIIPGAAFGVSAMGAKNDASTLMTQGKNLAAQVKAGDMSGAKVTANELSNTADKLHQTTNGPLWAAATAFPVLGEDVKQVRALTDVADTLSGQVLLPVVEGLPSNGISGLFEGGNLNVQALQNMLIPLGSSASTIHKCADQMDDLGDPHLDQLKKPVSTIKSALDVLDTLSAHATELSDVLPGMLGAQGQRTYLLVACTGAEIRSTGGFPGSAGLMTVNNGHIEIGEFSSPVNRVPNLTDENKVPVPADEERIFGKRISECFVDTTFIPNFPRAADLMKQIWEHYPETNPNLDGIICLDPVFLQRVLALTGGVTTADGTVVDGNNAAEMLMNTVYIKYANDNDAQDALFAQVAAHALGQVFGNIGSVDMVKFGKTLVKSFEDRRIYAWMVNANEQAVLENLKWTNSVSNSTAAPETGVYFGSAMGAKMNWYLDVDTQVSAPTKNSDGTTSYNITVVLKNKISEDMGDAPWYIVGSDPAQRDDTDMLLDLYLYAPAGGKITNMQTNGYFTGQDYFHGDWNTMPGDQPMTRAEYAGHEVWFGMTQMLAETETTLNYTVTTAPAAQEPLKLVVTPLPDERNM